MTSNDVEFTILTPKKELTDRAKTKRAAMIAEERARASNFRQEYSEQLAQLMPSFAKLFQHEYENRIINNKSPCNIEVFDSDRSWKYSHLNLFAAATDRNISHNEVRDICREESQKACENLKGLLEKFDYNVKVRSSGDIIDYGNTLRFEHKCVFDVI